MWGRDVGILETGYCEASESMRHSRYIIWVGGAYSRKYFGRRFGRKDRNIRGANNISDVPGWAWPESPGFGLASPDSGLTQNWAWPGLAKVLSFIASRTAYNLFTYFYFYFSIFNIQIKQFTRILTKYAKVIDLATASTIEIKTTTEFTETGIGLRN